VQGDVTGTAPAASLEQRVAVLEAALNEEREARQMLEDELFALLSEEFDDYGYRGAAADDSRVAPNEMTAATPTERRRGSDRRGRDETREARATRLVEAGFDPARADWIVQRESELQMESLQTRYEAGRSGDMGDFYRNRGDYRETLRTELGDVDYSRYLAANGRQTDIQVYGVLDSSPAQTAGLRPGDRIQRYGGQRIFTVRELTEQTLQGNPGENVAVDILRDGMPMQVVLPRGPLGVTGGPR
jgi:C-terminal processing protease CtpA/Prc